MRNQVFFKRFLPLVLALALILGLAPAALAQAPETTADLNGQIVILHTNDSHSRLADNMGFSSVAALKKAYEAAGATVLLFDVGDTLHGKPIVTINKGENAVKVLNAVGYDAMTPGNHDFNYGAARLMELEGMMKFPLLAGNVRKDGKAVFNSATIIEKNGVKFGIMGLTTPETAYKTNPLNVKGITFEAPVDRAFYQVRALKRAGVDYIIALCHLGLEGQYTSENLAKRVKGIDVLIDGHSHSVLPEGMLVNGALIASTGEYINNIGVVHIDADGEKTASLVNAEAFLGKDKKIDKLIAKMQKDTDKKLKVVVGATSVELDGVRDHVRTRETNLGNLVADALKSATGADVAMNNGGGIRATIPVGKITKAQVLEVLPFGNYAVLKRVSGKDILDILELGIKDYPEASGGFPQVAGVRFEFDPAKPAGSRIVNAWIGDEKLDKNKSYTFATNDFLSAGGDGYTMLAKAPTLGEYPALEEIVIDFIANNANYEAKEEGRSVALGVALEQDAA